MYSGSGVASNLNELATSLLSINNGDAIYLYKDSSGTVLAKKVEQYLNVSNFGLAYNFINGDVVYTATPIASYTAIPWDYPSSILSTASLWDSHLVMWIDSKEAKSISNDMQKIISKSYSAEKIFNETTTSQSFVWSDGVIDLTSYANIESATTLTVQQYFKLALVVTIPTQNINNVVLFQHNYLQIRISQQAAPDTVSTTYMISVFNNGTFCKGITFKPTDLTYKYFIYCDDAGVLYVNGNTSNHVSTPNFYQATSAKIYIGQNSAGANNSAIKVHEILYYTSASNDITPTRLLMETYFASRWSVSTYTDNYNIVPIPPDPWSISGSKTYFYFDYADFATSPSTFTHTGIGQFAHITGTYTYTANAADAASRTAKKALTLTGTDTRVYIDDLTIMPNTASNDYVLIILLKVTGASANGYNILRNQSASGLSELCVFSTNGQLQYYPNYTTGSYYNFFTGSWGNNQYTLVTLKRGNCYDGSANGNYDSTTATVRINGEAVTTSASGYGSFTAKTLTSNYSLQEASGWTTHIAAQYISKGQLTQTQIEQVEGYIAHSSMTQPPSVTGLLPNTHPYYASAPLVFS